MLNCLVIPPVRLHSNRDVGFKELLPHIGVVYVASFLHAKGVDVRVIDSPAEGLNLPGVVKRIRDLSPGVVALTANTYQLGEARAVAREAKAALPGVRAVIGGYHASALPEQTLREFGEFDFVVYGEGEETALELLRAIEGGGDVSEVRGIARRSDGEIRVNPPRPWIENLDSLPFPAYELFPVHRYRGPYVIFSGLQRPLSACTTRGCPYRCVFCFRSAGDRLRARSVESVVGELQNDVEKFNPTQILFTDETFTINRAHAARLCEEILRRHLDRRFRWFCQTRVDAVDRELLALMKRAGCIVVSYGVESGDQKILDGMGKRIKIEDAVEAVRMARRAGILVDTNFIIGNPGDTHETIRETIRFAIRLDPHAASFAILTPFPGTEVARLAERGEGGLRLVSGDWQHYSKQLGSALELEHVSSSDLLSFHRRAYQSFYLRPRKIFYALKVVNPVAVPIYLWHTLLEKLRSVFNRKR